jgi:dipeptidyl aminopeptidase/acylaminoacyl peptidase
MAVRICIGLPSTELPSSPIKTGGLIFILFRSQVAKRSCLLRATLWQSTSRFPLIANGFYFVAMSVDKPGYEVLTPGTGLEWTPTVTGDGKTVVFLSATAQRPPWPAIVDLTKSQRSLQLIATEAVPRDYPSARLIVPKPVTFKSADGLTIHGQLFEPTGNGKKPAIVYVHGGPPRQMLLGWHYSDYYSNTYAINQYLASLGFAVLTVNYRLGIGYGYEFHQPAHCGPAGASEYNDIKAAGQWLSSQQGIDPSRIGIYGGSYGGFLTAMALARDSKLFAAGVDIHGVHDWTTSRFNFPNQGRFEKIPALESTIKTAWESSPVAYINSWASPVLLIHGDDDRNVPFSQSTDLYKRLVKKGVAVETIVIVDDTHHWLKFSNALTVDNAIADFFVRKFLKK